MSQSTLILIVLSLFLGLGAWLVFVWAARTGEFDDVEGPKHRMLEEDPDEHRGGSPGAQSSIRRDPKQCRGTEPPEGMP